MLAARFDALLIDFYGTICAGDREAVERICTRLVRINDLPLRPQQLAVRWGERFFGIIGKSNHDCFRSLFECEHVSLKTTLAQLGVRCDVTPFVAELEDYWRNPPVYADALRFLRTMDVPIGCVSNADTEPLRAAIEKHGLAFDAIVTSEQVGCYKPDPRVFQEGLKALGVSPGRAVHIGDSLHSDIEGAAALGIGTIWLRRRDRIHDIGDPESCQPDYIIHTLDEIQRLTL